MNIGRKVAKDGVHACVLRIFFRFALVRAQLCKCFLRNDIAVAENKKITFVRNWQIKDGFFCFVGV